MEDISQIKDLARKSAFAARKSVHGSGLDGAVNQNLLACIAQYPQAQIIAGYMPIRTEVSPLRAMTQLHAEGRKICVPVIIGADMPLEFHHWTPDCEMMAGPFGAAIPADATALQPDLLITPLLAFDDQCFRLGYGGGFYDRSFEQLNTRQTTVGIGLAYSAQRIAHVPRDRYDHQLDRIVTELG